MVKFTVFRTFVYRARAFVSAFTAPILADHKTPKSNGLLAVLKTEIFTSLTKKINGITFKGSLS